MGKIPQPRDLALQIADLERRMSLRERAPLINTFPSIAPFNAAVNQNVPASGNFDGSNWFDVVFSPTCVFTIGRPTAVLWRSVASVLATNPGGGAYVHWATAISAAPWNPAAWIFRSRDSLLDVRTAGYQNLLRTFSIGTGAVDSALGPGAAALGITSPVGPLPPGTYEVRQQMQGDVGTQAAYFQGFIEVFGPGA